MSDPLGEMRSFAPESHFRWLYEHRQSPEPPPGLRIWLFGVNIGTGFARQRLAWSTSGVLEPYAAAETPRAYLATFTTGYVGFQVFGPDLDGVDRARPPHLPVLSSVQTVLNQVWPAPRKPPLR